MRLVQSKLSNLEQRLRALETRKEEFKKVDIKTLIADCYHGIHDDIAYGLHEFYNLPGGRGSCKSSFCSLEIVEGIMNDVSRQSNALVVRKFAVTLRGSVYTQIQWAIDSLGVSNLWKATYNPMQFTYVTGQVIRLTGLDDPQKLKSMKPSKGYFKYLWLEEFSEIDGELELRNLQQSVLRGGNKFTVFRSFNPPISTANWANEFVAIPDDRSLTLLTDYRQIPREWLGDTFIEEAERLKTINPKAYEHEYLGVPVGTGGEVFPNIEIRKITDEEINNFEYYFEGIDFGFASDPCCYICLAYDHKTETVYFIEELYKRGLSNKQLADEVKAMRAWREHDFMTRIICDCAEPKSIADLKYEGLYVGACYKRAGCVEYRVKWLQHRKLVIDPDRTPNAYREFTRYSYPVDKNGLLESRLEDKDNHTIDAAAYALNSVIYKKEYSA